MGFVVDKVTLGLVFLQVLQFKLASYKLQYQETNLVTFSNLYSCYLLSLVLEVRQIVLSSTMDVLLISVL